jgi:beta-glucosidase
MYDVFNLPPITFPEGFLWGSSTAAHQIEGNNIHSNFWAKEQKGGIWSQWDIDEPSGLACDHWRLFREDVKLLARLGHRVYRLSIEWSRIEPAEGQWDKDAIAHYVELLALLCENNIKPMVTLHHFTHPLWFEERGEFNQDENLPFFYRFVERLVPEIKDYVFSWNVFNEFNRGGYYGSPRKLKFLRAHAHVYRYLKSVSAATVSSAHALSHFFPSRHYDKFDHIMCQFLDHITNEFFFHAIRTGEFIYPDMDAVVVPELKGAIDYWAINFYTREMVDSRKASCQGGTYPHKFLRLIDRKFYLEEFYPEGLGQSLQRFTDRPVVITENGCSADDDRFRIVYIAQYLSAIHDAIQRGVDVDGYIYWSTMDNYEWGSYKPRFGLVSVDRATFAREPKPSADFFKEIIAHNGFSGATVRKYLSELPTTATS